MDYSQLYVELLINLKDLRKKIASRECDDIMALRNTCEKIMESTDFLLYHLSKKERTSTEMMQDLARDFSYMAR